MKKLITLQLLLIATIFSQDRSTIFNTGPAPWTCSTTGGIYDNYTCDLMCDSHVMNDDCIIIDDGFSIGQGQSIAERFTVSYDYAFEAFGVYIKSDSPIPLDVIVKVHTDANNQPGATLGEWVISVNNISTYYSLYTGDSCVDFQASEYYWLSVNYTQDLENSVTWLHTQTPFWYTAISDDSGISWSEEIEYGFGSAATIWAERIYESDWQPSSDGDINNDNISNILDIVGLVSFVLDDIEFDEEQQLTADMNNDQIVNILDIVLLVNYILFGPDPMPIFSYEDINPNSDYYGQFVGPETFLGNVSLYYFGKAGWSHCRHRFGVLNDLYLELQTEGITNVNIIGNNGYQYINDSYDCMICSNACTSSSCEDGPRILPWTQDLDSDEDGNGDVWVEWDVTLRDLVFLDRNGYYVTRINLTSYNPDPEGVGECTDNYQTIKNLILELIEQ